MSSESNTPSATIIHGECIAEMRKMPDNSIDSIVCDPPYGLGFMGKGWDTLPPGLEWAEECLRVLKPGGHLVAFGGSRTWHRLAVAVEDAGFEIRDSIAWLYGTGFPKSRDVSKAIDKQAGATTHESHEFTVAGRTAKELPNPKRIGYVKPKPVTDDAKKWAGFGTALKPAFEPCVVARKPVSEKTVAANVLVHGTGAINIDANRIGKNGGTKGTSNDSGSLKTDKYGFSNSRGSMPTHKGRWPANVMLDESMAEVLDAQSGQSKSPPVGSVANKKALIGQVAKGDEHARVSPNGHGDSGGASRFFYVAKAPKSERPSVDGVAHPTVKPLTLMRTLVSLFTPPGGIVLDTFAGSGTTVEAALLEGFNVIGIEKTGEYLPLIQSRIDRVTRSVLCL